VNTAATLSAGSALVAFLAGLMSRRLARAPGAAEQRWFSVVVLASAAYAVCNLSTTIPTSPFSVFLLCGVEVALLAVLVWGWIRFSQDFAGVQPGPAERAVSTGLLVAVPVLAVPGILFAPRVVDRSFPAFGVVYRQAVTTVVGDAVFVALCVIAGAVLVRLARAALRGVPHAALITLAYAAMLACAVLDALTTALSLPLPFLLDWGIAPSVLAVGYMNTCRLVDSTCALERLRGDLEVRVQARTLELSAAMERLHQAEKLAALGRFANGVAHEVNNPAAVVNASLGFLAREPHRLGPEELDAVRDAAEGMRQITTLVRRLVDAGRVASPPGLAVADVPAAIASVVKVQPAAVRARIAVDTSACAGACVRLRPDTLERVVETLVRNAADASPPDAPDRIEIAAVRQAGRVRITVVDHGVGMTAETLGRAFDPFFTTKPEGRGSGLGLSVARGLIQASGGTIELESEAGVGTRAIVQLPEAARRGPAEAEPWQLRRVGT
jgi:signal transduction histidine kinase